MESNADLEEYDGAWLLGDGRTTLIVLESMLENLTHRDDRVSKINQTYLTNRSKTLSVPSSEQARTYDSVSLWSLPAQRPVEEHHVWCPLLPNGFLHFFPTTSAVAFSTAFF